MIMGPSKTIAKGDIEEQRMLQSRHIVREYDYFTYKTLKDAREAFEKDFIIRKLQENDWNISKTSDTIAIERSNLHKKIKSYGITETRP
jgi:two-component system nitrogen regulation response regulator NtrX